jgi:hypothetical protein
LNNSNKIILQGNNQKVIEKIMESKNNEIFIAKRKLSKKLFYLLITNTKIKKLLISKPVYKQISKKNIEAIKNLNIEVKIIKSERGRPIKFNKNKISKIKKYKTAKRKFMISKTSFYNFKKQKSE